MSDEPQETVPDPHRIERVRAMTSPEYVIANAVVAACGAPILTRTRITDGFSNEVYAATTARGQQVIVRIHWYQEGPYFEEERWTLDQCARIGFPAPRLLLLQHIKVEGKLHSVCVETRLEGRTLHALFQSGTLGAAEPYPLVVEAGALLAQLHSVSTTGWGRIDSSGTGWAANGSDLLHSAPIEQMYQAARNVGLHRADVDDALRLLHTNPGLWEGVEPRLLHGDFSPQHIMVSGSQITGFIDFEFPQSGDPAMDFAYWDYYHAEAFPTDWLLEGYRQHTLLPDTFRERIAMCRLLLGLALLSYHGTRDDQEPGFLAIVRSNLMRDLGEMRQRTITICEARPAGEVPKEPQH